MLSETNVGLFGRHPEFRRDQSQISEPSTDLLALMRDTFAIDVFARAAAKAKPQVSMNDKTKFAAALSAFHIPLPRLKQNTEPACE